MGACISSDILINYKISKPNQTHNQSILMDYSTPAFKPTSNFIIAASPIGEKPSSIVTRPMPLEIAEKYRLSSAKFRSFGSNEDMFFESQPWLESDGDDEFYSVNGDSTPSITSSTSNTPIHRLSNDTSARYKLTLSPVKKRKSLSELFKEDEEEENHENSNRDTSSSDDDTLEFSPTSETPKSATYKPQYQQHASANSNVDVKVKKGGALKSDHHCFPRLFSVHNLNMSKKNSIVAA